MNERMNERMNDDDDEAGMFIFCRGRAWLLELIVKISEENCILCSAFSYVPWVVCCWKCRAHWKSLYLVVCLMLFLDFQFILRDLLVVTFFIFWGKKKRKYCIIVKCARNY